MFSSDTVSFLTEGLVIKLWPQFTHNKYGNKIFAGPFGKYSNKIFGHPFHPTSLYVVDNLGIITLLFRVLEYVLFSGVTGDEREPNFSAAKPKDSTVYVVIYCL